LLEALLSAGLDYLDEALNSVAVIPIGVGTAVQIAALSANTAGLRLLLQQPSCRVTFKHSGPLPFGLKMPPRGKIFEAVEDSMTGCPDRRLVALVRAKAKKEKEEAANGRVTNAGAGAGGSNTFEDPSVRVLTAAEEKKKAKKRAAKKKAKAKKRAAEASAAGGAGTAAAADDDSDSSGTDEEEAGMDEEERMLARAPTFDLEKEKAARKAKKEAGGLDGVD
jgi:hypothetical protein